MNRPPGRILATSVAGLSVVLLVAFSIRSVPSGQQGTIGVGRNARIKGPGIHLVSPLSGRMSLWPAGQASVPVTTPNPGGGKILLLGIDSADWTIIDRLRKEGELPVLSRLIEHGASGPLRSIEPLLSPLIWTTIATGVSPASTASLIS